MAETLNIVEGSKEEKYVSLLPQLQAVLEGETDFIANLANTCACLREQFGWLWIGFYLVKKDELVLGPFQGPLACTRIARGKGVCGKSWESAATVIVPDVNLFPGHIACSGLSRSEIVVPLLHEGKVIGVLDIDSEQPNEFGETDRRYLEEVVRLLV